MQQATLGLYLAEQLAGKLTLSFGAEIKLEKRLLNTTLALWAG